MINQMTIETTVVIKNFLNNCGLLGAPGSSPSIQFPDLLFFILIGSDMKKINHQINKKMIIEPVIPKLYFF